MNDSLTKRDSVSTSGERRDAVSPTASMLLPWTVEGPFPGQRETKKRHGFAAYANIVNRLGMYVAQGLPPEVAAGIVEAVNGRDRLRDIVRRLEDEYEQMEERDTVCNTDRTRRIEALFREAREVVGESMKEGAR